MHVEYRQQYYSTKCLHDQTLENLRAALSEPERNCLPLRWITESLSKKKKKQKQKCSLTYKEENAETL